MSITADGWLDWAVWEPGPFDKVYPEPNAAMGYVPHSAVGYYPGWRSRLWSDERNPDGTYTDYAAASVHGWIAYDGKVTQHYPFWGLRSSCWASGNPYANTHFVAFENEGGYSPHDEPLTHAQKAANVRIIRELSRARGWTPRRPINLQDKTATLYEHHECVKLWGGRATACPSNRIPWRQFLEMLEEDDMALREDVMELMAELEALKASQAFQNGLLVGLYGDKEAGVTGAIPFLSTLAVNHEQRIKSLEIQVPTRGR